MYSGETPGDGQRKCPKHLEFLDKNKFGKISASVGFIKKKFVTVHGHMNTKQEDRTMTHKRKFSNFTTQKYMGLIHIQEGYELVIPAFEAPKQPRHSLTLSLTTSDSLGGF